MILVLEFNAVNLAKLKIGDCYLVYHSGEIAYIAWLRKQPQSIRRMLENGIDI